jgi:hypothetical protein
MQSEFKRARARALLRELKSLFDSLSGDERAQVTGELRRSGECARWSAEQHLRTHLEHALAC